MSTFPPIPNGTSANSQAEFNSIATQLGITVANLDPISQLQLVGANLMSQAPPISGSGIYNVMDPRFAGGAKGDGVHDDAAAIQATLDAAASAIAAYVIFPPGTYRITAPLMLHTQLHLIGSGIRSVIKADFPANVAIPTISPSTYSPVLSYPPILYNASAIQWWSIRDLTLDGNNTDVYGLWLCENYYGRLVNVVVQNCNKRPYTGIRSQVVQHQNFVCYGNKDGALLFNTTAVAFTTCGFERNQGAFALRLRQPSTSFNKGGVRLTSLWFEGDTTNNPTTAFLELSGRSIQAGPLFFVLGIAPTTEQCIRFVDSGDALTVDGINMAAAPVLGADVTQLDDASTPSMYMYIGSGTSGCYISGQISAANVTNASGDTTVTVRPFGSGIDQAFFQGEFEVRKSFTSGVPVTSTNYNLRVVDDLITLFTQSNNFIKNNSGILELAANQNLRLRSGTTAGQNVVVLNRSDVSDWQSGHLVLGAYHFWVDGFGVERIKSSAPATATDGVPLGQKVTVPATATSSGAPGQWAADTSNAYFYTGDGTTHSWRRVAIAAW